MAGGTLESDIYIGGLNENAIFHFTNADIVLNSIKGIFNADVIANELPIDSFYVTIRYDPTRDIGMVLGTSTDNEVYAWGESPDYTIYEVRNEEARDLMTSIPYGTPVWWYVGSSFKAKGYASKIERTGKYTYKLTCISGIGLLSDKIHVGGLYSGESFAFAMLDIVGTTFPYAIGERVRGIRIYGHLPYDTARNNLHRLLFAVGAVMVQRNYEEDYLVRFLSDDNVTTIPSNRISIGGKVDYQLPTNRVEITEHGFFKTANDEEVVLYDNSGDQAVSNLTVLFQNAPAYDVTATGNLTISELSVNHAVVSGTGTLTGKLYTHSRQIMVVSENPNNDPERTRRVTDNELINSLNSRSVAQRVLAYYMRTRIINSKLIVTSEQPGSYVELTDDYGDPIAGYIQQMEFMPTSVKAAMCKIADGFVSNAYGNTFTNRVLYRYANYMSGFAATLTINTAKTKALRIVLIGGGSGGQAGFDGEDGDSPDRYSTTSSSWSRRGWQDEAHYFAYDASQGHEQKTPQGGEGGEPGTQGKIYVFDIDLSSLPDNTEYAIALTGTIGAGGVGGESNGALGTAGGDTSISFTNPVDDSVVSHSSSEGATIAAGWSDIMTGNVYLLPGAVGVRGGNGGKTDELSDAASSGFEVWTRARRIRNGNLADAVHSIGYAGFPGESVGNSVGGAGGAGYGYDGTSDAGGLKGFNLYPMRHKNRDDTVVQSDIWESTYQFPQAAAGGGGGGAAYGSNGGNGSSYSRSTDTQTSAGTTLYYGGRVLHTGNGGNGANAKAPVTNVYGGGGHGGNGGGAGGNGGGGYNYGEYYDDTHNEEVEPDYEFESFVFINTDNLGGKGGTGGLGSRGGNGGEGAIIIYS